MHELNLKELFIGLQIIFFFVGIAFKAAISRYEDDCRFGFRIVYILIPMFFVGYYSSEFFLKDWSNK